MGNAVEQLSELSRIYAAIQEKLVPVNAISHEEAIHAVLRGTGKIRPDRVANGENALGRNIATTDILRELVRSFISRPMGLSRPVNQIGRAHV